MALAQFARTALLVALIVAAFTNSARAAPITFDLTINDPGNTSVSLYPAITSNVLAAAAALGSHFSVEVHSGHRVLQERTVGGKPS
jgi:hypothetical protein